MSRHATAAISAIDRALGDALPTTAWSPSVWCWRCQTTRGSEPGMMCQPCRDYMCGETDDDPKSRRSADAHADDGRWPLLRVWSRR